MYAAYRTLDCRANVYRYTHDTLCDHIYGRLAVENGMGDVRLELATVVTIYTHVKSPVGNAPLICESQNDVHHTAAQIHFYQAVPL